MLGLGFYLFCAYTPMNLFANKVSRIGSGALPFGLAFETRGSDSELIPLRRLIQDGQVVLG